ncbi:hypothetical protein TSUD_99620 [Trifolium subterraneum]|uniref:Uncharacterized protein n=1 Tax=Trifolium subterraneum TaxID=3900 RepID=A0A2Z6PGJ9_TRISU|nr:hypothetical protein TSUD_99620 [Trifolium subterraneum]
MFDFTFELYVQEADTTCEQETVDVEEKKDSFVNETTNKSSFSSVSSEKSPKVADNFEPINIEGQQETGVWVHHPGNEVCQTWEPRKGKNRRLDTEIRGEPNDISDNCNNSNVSGSLHNDSSSPDDNVEDKHRMKTVRKGLHKIGSVFRRSQKKYDRSDSIPEDVPSPHDNIRSVNASKGVGVKFVMDDSIGGFPTGKIQVEGGSPEGSGSPDSPAKRDVKDVAKNIYKHAEKSARSLKHVLSRKTRKSKGDSAGSVQEIVNESDSSDDESSLSVQSPIDERTPVFSQAIPPSNIGSPKSNLNPQVIARSNIGSPKSNLNEVYNAPSNIKLENARSPERFTVEVKSGEDEHVKEEMVADKRVVVSSIAE